MQNLKISTNALSIQIGLQGQDGAKVWERLEVRDKMHGCNVGARGGQAPHLPTAHGPQHACPHHPTQTAELASTSLLSLSPHTFVFCLPHSPAVSVSPLKVLMSHAAPWLNGLLGHRLGGDYCGPHFFVGSCSSLDTHRTLERRGGIGCQRTHERIGWDGGRRLSCPRLSSPPQPDCSESSQPTCARA